MCVCTLSTFHPALGRTVVCSSIEQVIFCPVEGAWNLVRGTTACVESSGLHWKLPAASAFRTSGMDPNLEVVSCGLLPFMRVTLDISTGF